MKKFVDLGLSEKILKVIEKKGFEEATPIQEKTIPAILKGDKDIVAQAQTGTGKTAAFGLPIIELIQPNSKMVQVIVLVPTRELAIQVSEEISSLKGEKRLNIIPIYGGQSIGLQLSRLRKGVDIIVGTPGRVIDHLERKTLKIDNVSFLVLDEADEMLNMGFLEDVNKIIEKTGDKKRTMLFSATMPPEILKIAKKYMGDYELIKVTHGQLTCSQTDQIYFEVANSDRFEALCRIIDMEEDFYGLIFCRTKVDVDTVASRLSERGYSSDGLHGDISQASREKILNRFRKKNINILVATDVAARGIDVQDLTHVINFSLPQDPESYVHRVGRTGRAGKEGIAITFITSHEYHRLQFIQRKAKTDIRKASLPKIKDIIKTKRIRIQSKLEAVIKSKPTGEYIEMSRDLLKDSDPENILAALLKYSFEDELSSSSYIEIEQGVVDKKGKTRLFVSRGKNDGLTSKKLVEYIMSNCKIRNDRIKDILILDKFAFVTLPFNEAEMLLSKIKNKKKGSGPFITKAKKAGNSKRRSLKKP